MTFKPSPFGQIVWEDRYALKDENGVLVEKDVSESFRRVAKAIASKEKNSEKWEEAFYGIMSDHYFCPAGRILAHSGTHYSQILNCFVLPFEDDSLENIMETAKKMAVIQKFGGGTGFNYSRLRPAGSHIKGVNGHSCGTPGFIHMMSTISEVIEQGGSRRGANLGILEIWHPDIWEFISFKNQHNWERLREIVDVKDEEKWNYFKYENLHKWQMYNVSVGVNDEFLEALKSDDVWPLVWKGEEWELYTVSYKKALPDGTFKEKSFDVTADEDSTAIWKVKRKVPYPTSADKFEVVSRRKIKASELWDLIAYNAWADGCPGLVNISEMRRMHPLEYEGTVEAANPCGEQPLPAYGSCNLSSIILPSFVVKDKGVIDFDKLRKVVHTAIRFGDNVIDNCEFPIPEIKAKALKERRIGLGTMGVHDMLIELHLCYDSDEGRALVDQVLSFIRNEACKASIEIAKEKGSFPAFNKKKFLKSGFIKTLPKDIQKGIEDNGIRNGALLSQAPTGTIGAFNSISSGCEPWIFLSFQRNTRLGSFEDGCPSYLKWKKDHPQEPKPLYYKESAEIAPDDHVKMMVLFSKYVDSAVSKTINLPSTATVDDIKNAFLHALDEGVKGLTVFRDSSKEGVLVNKNKIIKEATKTVHDMQGLKTESAESRTAPRKRGSRTVGATYRVHMQKHNLYITINRNSGGDLVEVFATVGESKNMNTTHTSGVEDSWAEGLGKIISLALRAGVEPDAIIRNLKNIPSDKPVFCTVGDCETSECLSSPPHAIARVLEEEMQYTVSGSRKEVVLVEGKPCTECGSTKTKPKSPTCYLCLDCGYEGCSS